MAKKAFAWLSAAKLSMHGEQKTDNAMCTFHSTMEADGLLYYILTALVRFWTCLRFDKFVTGIYKH